MVRQALVYDYVEDILERRVPHREAHLALVRQWHGDARLAMAGALGDPPSGALLVFDVDRAAVEDFVAADPYVAAGLVTAWRIEPWNVVTA